MINTNMINTQSYPSPAKAWWAMTVLFLAYTFSFIDRTILALLVEPLKRDLSLSDTEISLLHGLAFAIFYSTMGVPIAILADKKSRRAIIGIGVFFWSLMTVLCGVANSFWKLFAARLGVGVGEAALGPATYSLVADLFPEHVRGRAMGFFATGIHVGAGLALIVGGFVVGLAADVGEIETAFGTFRSWQIVFFVVGAPGILIALLAATMVEPVRNVVAKAADTASGDFKRYMATFKAALTTHFIGFAICGLVFSGVSAWAPTYMIRQFGYTPAEAGYALGIAVFVWGTIGAMAGGALADRWAAKPDAAFRVGLIGLFMETVCAVGFGLVENATLCVVLFSIICFFGAFAYPAGASGIQRVVPAPLRARVSAIYLMVVTIIGAAFGPTSIALLTDQFFADRMALGYSIALAIGAIGPIGCVMFLVGLKPFGAAVVAQPHYVKP